MSNGKADETFDDQDDAVEIQVELEEPFTIGPSCDISWVDGQAVIECATPEDAELAAELLTLVPVKVTVKTPLEGTSPSEEPSDGGED